MIPRATARAFHCPQEHAHASNGTLTCYTNHGCRCDDCRELSREYSFWRDHMNQAGHTLMVDATGTRRRLQALMRLGWSLEAIAERLDNRRGNIRRLLTAPRLTRTLAKRITTVYDELSMTVPEGQTRPQRAAIARTRIFAARRGWLPPLAWDDIDTDATPPPTTAADGTAIDAVAVELAIAGRDVHLSPAERRECVRELHARRWSDRKIAGQIRCAERTVERIRAELALPAWDVRPITEQRVA